MPLAIVTKRVVSTRTANKISRRLNDHSNHGKHTL